MKLNNKQRTVFFGIVMLIIGVACGSIGANYWRDKAESKTLIDAKFALKMNDVLVEMTKSLATDCQKCLDENNKLKGITQHLSDENEEFLNTAEGRFYPKGKQRYYYEGLTK